MEDGWIGERRSALAAVADGDGSTHTRGWSGLGIFQVDDGWIGDFSLNFLGYMRGWVGAVSGEIFLGTRVFSQASGARVF
jgi:hypothetical protein